MDKSLGVQKRTLENIVLLASRLLLAWLFFARGCVSVNELCCCVCRHGQIRRSCTCSYCDNRPAARLRHCNRDGVVCSVRRGSSWIVLSCDRNLVSHKLRQSKRVA